MNKYIFNKRQKHNTTPSKKKKKIEIKQNKTRQNSSIQIKQKLRTDSVRNSGKINRPWFPDLIIIFIMSCHQRGSPWPSPVTRLYRPSLPVGLQSSNHPVSPQSWCIWVLAGRPAFDCSCEGVHRSKLLMSSCQHLQQCPALTITDTHYADDIALLQTSTQAETLVHSLNEQLQAC